MHFLPFPKVKGARPGWTHAEWDRRSGEDFDGFGGSSAIQTEGWTAIVLAGD